MNKETWCDIKGYEGYYQISNHGRVKALARTRRNGRNYKEAFVSQRKRNGYMAVALSGANGERKHFSIHRLVLEAFCPFPEMDKFIVNHKDENKCNNHIENLEWCTYQHNNTYGKRLEKAAKKRGKKVLCVETGIIYYSTGKAEKETGISHQNISAACRGKLKQANGFHWKYV